MRPGGDFDLAMAVAARLFETSAYAIPDAPSYCDHFDAFRALALSRSADDVGARGRRLARGGRRARRRALAEKPCSIQVGWGMGRRMNGSAIVRALDALGAVSGNLGIPGGGVSFYYKRRGAFDTSFLKKNPPRTIPEPLLGAGILAAAGPAGPRRLGHGGQPRLDAAGLGDGRARARDARARRRRGLRS